MRFQCRALGLERGAGACALEFYGPSSLNRRVDCSLNPKPPRQFAQVKHPRTGAAHQPLPTPYGHLSPLLSTPYDSILRGHGSPLPPTASTFALCLTLRCGYYKAAGCSPAGVVGGIEKCAPGTLIERCSKDCPAPVEEVAKENGWKSGEENVGKSGEENGGKSGEENAEGEVGAARGGAHNLRSRVASLRDGGAKRVRGGVSGEGLGGLGETMEAASRVAAILSAFKPVRVGSQTVSLFWVAG